MTHISALDILENTICQKSDLPVYLEIAFFQDDDITFILGYVKFMDYYNQLIKLVDFKQDSHTISFEDVIEIKEIPLDVIKNSRTEAI